MPHDFSGSKRDGSNTKTLDRFYPEDGTIRENISRMPWRIVPGNLAGGIKMFLGTLPQGKEDVLHGFPVYSGLCVIDPPTISSILTKLYQQSYN